MDPLTLVSASQLAALAALTAMSALLSGTKVHLFANNIVFTANSALTDLVEATFDGYAASSAVVFGAPYIDPLGTARITAPAKQFLQTGIVVTNVVYGWYLTDTAGAILIGGANFPQPVPFSAINAGVTVEPSLAYGG